MNGHPTRPEDFDLYVLGVLEGEEKAAFEAHVPTCAACAEKLAEARGRISLLAFAAPPIAPSPSVKERLMRQIHAAPIRVSAQRERARAPREPERTVGPFPRWGAGLGGSGGGRPCSFSSPFVCGRRTRTSSTIGGGSASH